MQRNLLVCALDLWVQNGYSSVMVCGLPVNCVTSARYLGVYLEISSTFKCSFQSNKAKFYQAFDCIFGKIGRVASEEVIFAPMKSKCLPVLYFMGLRHAL